jgi:hypothetical protein
VTETLQKDRNAETLQRGQIDDKLHRRQNTVPKRAHFRKNRIAAILQKDRIDEKLHRRQNTIPKRTIQKNSIAESD